MLETWRAIPGYPDHYQVSDLGRVRSLDREQTYVVQRGGRSVEVQRRHRGRILSPGVTPSGHLVVALRRGRAVQVHHLVLFAFVGPRPEGTEGLHGDGCPANNRVSNLRWGTRLENVRDTYRHGTILLGERHHQAKLTAVDVISIRRAGAGASPSRLARRFGVHPTTIRSILARRIWAHLPDQAAA